MVGATLPIYTWLAVLEGCTETAVSAAQGLFSIAAYAVMYISSLAFFTMQMQSAVSLL